MPLLQEVEITSSLPSLSFNLLSHLVFFFSHLDTDKIQQHWIFVLRSKLSGVNSPGRHWKDFLCIENLWTRRDAGFSNLALKGIQTFCSWSKHITRWNGAVYIWAVWGCTADMCVHWKGKRGIKFRCPVHANSLPRFILTSRKKEMQQWHPVAWAAHDRCACHRALPSRRGEWNKLFRASLPKKVHSISRTCAAGFQSEVKTNKTTKSSFSLHLHHIQGLAPTSCVCAYMCPLSFSKS